MTGGRVKRIQDYIGGEPFMLTYGDGVADVSIPCFLWWAARCCLIKIIIQKRLIRKRQKLLCLFLFGNLRTFQAGFFKTLIVIYLIYPIIIKIYNNKKFCTLLATALFIFPFLYNKIIVLLTWYNPDFSINIVGREICLDTLPKITGLFTMYSILY